MEVLPKKFYERNPAKVAKDLLGKLLVRKINQTQLIGRIVETEAYYGKEDPASRAALGRPKYCVKFLYDTPGKVLIYNVHKHWLFNVVAHKSKKAGAVLIRAIEPIKGIEVMKRFRKVKDPKELTNGPGKLTQALKITKELNGLFVTQTNSPIFIVKGKKVNFNIGKSKRIGVRKDLPQKLRFFILGNEWVSR